MFLGNDLLVLRKRLFLRAVYLMVFIINKISSYKMIFNVAILRTLEIFQILKRT